MMRSTRRELTSTGVCLLAPLALGVSSALAVPVPGGSLDPLTIPKYVTPLVIPPALYDDAGAAMNVSVVAARSSPSRCCRPRAVLAAQALNPALACVGDAYPATTLWGYGDPARPGPSRPAGPSTTPPSPSR